MAGLFVPDRVVTATISLESLMSLKDRITEDMKSAMRAKDSARLSTIRLLLAAIKQREVDERAPVDDPQALVIIEKLIKQRRDSEQQYRAAGRDELAAQEAYEVSQIQAFMPAALSSDELSAIVTQAIKDAGVADIRDMGKAMALIKPQVQGRADMGEVSKLLKEQLSR